MNRVCSCSSRREAEGRDVTTPRAFGAIQRDSARFARGYVLSLAMFRDIRDIGFLR